MRARFASAIVMAALLVPASTHAAPGRWPLWPNEIEQRARALLAADDAPEGERAAALRALGNYPTELIEKLILIGLSDDSSEVRREAMLLCVDRNLRACLPAAKEFWMNTNDNALRARALDMFAAHPDEGRAELLIAAMLDDDASMRERATNALGRAALSDAQQATVRTLLQSKLDDVIATVRRRAAVALGRMGPGGGAVALIRRLEDADPSVREAAAEALGQLEDPAAVAPLLRSMAREPSRGFAQVLVRALARLPGDEVDAALLRFFDRPPHARRGPVVEALGLRSMPSALLVDGMIQRLRDPETHDDALRSLRLMGPAAVQGLREALRRGVEPSLRHELEQLMRPHSAVAAPANEDASAVPAQAESEFPTQDAGLSARALRDASDRNGVALRIGAAAPAWLAGRVSAALAGKAPPELAQPWLLALARAPARLRWDKADATELVTRLVARAHDAQSADAHRCLAMQALGSPSILANDEARELVHSELMALAQSANARSRGCAALGLARLNAAQAIEFLLADADPFVRAHASLAAMAPQLDLNRSLQSRLAFVAAQDEHASVRSCAAAVFALRKAASLSSGSGSEDHNSIWRRRERHAGAQSGWADFDVEGRRLSAPVLGLAGDQWLTVPSPLQGTGSFPGRTISSKSASKANQ